MPVNVFWSLPNVGRGGWWRFWACLWYVLTIRKECQETSLSTERQSSPTDWARRDDVCGASIK
jgi:hypothetical protein